MLLGLVMHAPTMEHLKAAYYIVLYNNIEKEFMSRALICQEK